MLGLKPSQFKEIRSVSRKLSLDKSKFKMLNDARKNGKTDEEMMASLFGDIPEGVTPKEYFQEKLTAQEFQALQDLIQVFTKGNGKNPLA